MITMISTMISTIIPLIIIIIRGLGAHPASVLRAFRPPDPTPASRTRKALRGRRSSGRDKKGAESGQSAK